ncbi:gamma-glutamylcyclotransferase [Sphingobium yanoikuyae]|jgi:gamma-glutamylcyclotransferase (GGCT)/AIG2-like uncharacterized protein YtfP|uniref:Gamma-glutamylcyclotransferase n=1 Tax=Sphingobium yanoikuyae TaxID=13690 RepID=A0A430BPX8_SPHYA|nr:gamma-glutamylcyclotransferase [Sphingobium yanoikuyae]RSU54762.1 gamma-glutamylcyclotransferase [Sphingobium yanoikuyae]
MDRSHCLATYGTLAPGRANHHQLAELQGSWQAGHVTGHLVAHGWAASMGFPAFIPDEGGAAVPVQLFRSSDLPAHWARLDAFEGADYRRVAIDVITDQGRVPAWIYVYAGIGG